MTEVMLTADQFDKIFLLILYVGMALLFATGFQAGLTR